MSLFGKTQDRPPEEPPPPQRLQPAAAQTAAAAACVIGPKTVIKGDVTGEEDVRVEGSVEGTIRIGSRLSVAPGGTVKADVEARSAVIAGELIGNCSVSERFELQATGRMTGNIHAPKIVIAEGAVFRGQSDMTGSAGKAGPAATS